MLCGDANFVDKHMSHAPLSKNVTAILVCSLKRFKEMKIGLQFFINEIGSFKDDTKFAVRGRKFVGSRNSVFYMNIRYS